MDALSIGQVAKQVGMGVETVRFYEREGLLEKPSRNKSGYRQYPQEVIARIQFIKRAKELGFSLKQIKELLSLRVDPDTTCDMVKARAEHKIADIECKIKTLQKMKLALVRLTTSCQGAGPTSKCPILDFLEAKKNETAAAKLSKKNEII